MPTRGGWAREAVRTLNPGYFALVMATGIVSVAMQNEYAYPISVMFVVAGRHRVRRATCRLPVAAGPLSFRRCRGPVRPGRAFGYVTFVAATGVLGTRLAPDQHHMAALVLLAVGWLAWLVLGYVIPWTVVLGRAPRPILQTPTAPGSSGPWRANRSRC